MKNPNGPMDLSKFAPVHGDKARADRERRAERWAEFAAKDANMMRDASGLVPRFDVCLACGAAIDLLHDGCVYRGRDAFCLSCLYDDDAPLVKGGQGRSTEAAVTAALIACWCALAAAVVLAGAVVWGLVR